MQLPRGLRLNILILPNYSVSSRDNPAASLDAAKRDEFTRDEEAERWSIEGDLCKGSGKHLAVAVMKVCLSEVGNFRDLVTRNPVHALTHGRHHQRRGIPVYHQVWVLLDSCDFTPLP